MYADLNFCNLVQPIAFSQLLGKSTLILGESNVGKTEITSKFLSYLCHQPDLSKIIVFDMGPERFESSTHSIGGKLADYNRKYKQNETVQEFSYPIIPPRSSSKNQSEVLDKCFKNYAMIKEDFAKTIQSLMKLQDKSALIVNDFSIFLHLGSPIQFMKLLKSSQTIFVNAYFGQNLADDFGANISWREKIMVRNLFRHFDYSVHLI